MTSWSPNRYLVVRCEKHWNLERSASKSNQLPAEGVLVGGDDAVQVAVRGVDQITPLDFLNGTHTVLRLHQGTRRNAAEAVPVGILWFPHVDEEARVPVRVEGAQRPE